MFKELAALRVLHDFPELLYLGVGRQRSLTELLEEDFSCFRGVSRPDARFWIGGLTRRLLGG